MTAQTAQEVLQQFTSLDAENQEHFLNSLGTWLLLRLGEGGPIMLQFEEYRKLEIKSRLYGEVKRSIDSVETHL